MTKPERPDASIEQLLASMNKWGASDLFVSVGKGPAIRVDGAVMQADLQVTTAEEMDRFLANVLSDEGKSRFEAAGDLDVATTLADGRRFRMNLSRQRGSISLVARALPSGELTFEDLLLPESVAKLADRQRGLVLVTGSTGSGKSTTLAAMIHHINTTRRAHIITIEDPIEFVHRDIEAIISQRQVGSDTVSFRSALKHVVRESPDVILIGEMRDMETMQVALSAALTGHLVLSTLHTIDCSQTVQRILSYYPEGQRNQAALDLSLSLQGIISQRLLPKKDGKGRVVAVEALTVTPAAAKLIRGQQIDDLVDLMQASEDPDTTTFNRALLERYRAGLITFDVGKAGATNADEFALATQGMSVGVQAFRGEGDLDSIAGLDVKRLVEMALARGASDLHLSVGRPPILRIAGSLEPLPIAPLSAGDMRMLLYSMMTVRQRTVYELERELDFALSLGDGQRFRVNAYFQRGHMAAAMRAIPSEVPDAERLGLPDHLMALSDRPHGLLLVVGPTGSGKTTSLACLVDRINRTRSCRIITIEDPIEYTHEGILATVDQREVYADTQSFGAALKYILRQDPDVIMIGEMRDLETISAALTAAETGHLVLATLHTNDAVQTIDRIIDVFPSHQQSQARSQLALSLLAVISQRLLPRADGAGRVPAFEIMMATPAIRTLIRDGKMHQALSVIESSRRHGMHTMDHSIKELFESELITYEEAVRFVRQPGILVTT
jgi:twitching motility protein PilT